MEEKRGGKHLRIEGAPRGAQEKHTSGRDSSHALNANSQEGRHTSFILLSHIFQHIFRTGEKKITEDLKTMTIDFGNVLLDDLVLKLRTPA